MAIGRDSAHLEIPVTPQQDAGDDGRDDRVLGMMVARVATSAANPNTPETPRFQGTGVKCQSV